MQIQASRGPNEQFVVFGDLKPWKNTWLVHVKVLHAWKQYIQSVETMEFVLADETITPAGGAYRTTDHTWKMVFNQNTVITRSNHVNDELYMNLTDFQSVLSGTFDENFLIDVLGQVMDCGDVENIQCTEGKQQKKLEFTLSNISDSRLPCFIWGNLAEKLHSAINQEDGMVTMLLRFAKLGRFRGELQISNAFDASQMMINPSIPEAEAFKEL
ncbi:hypothetical protein F2Q69_00046389 [Brassica cretica]|uniref:DUF223 domain-containing protein n=1 Tax=Brassica cretica TaxID=69181 RepID=A0A8S9PP99_BRACR|nr:hypothetical protein F2Q69_00046389 [Brassica cretica]